MADRSIGEKWVVKREADNEVRLTLPDGMKFTSENLDISDIIAAIEKHRVLQSAGVTNKGQADQGEDIVSLRCCSGNTAIAAM